MIGHLLSVINKLMPSREERLLRRISDAQKRINNIRAESDYSEWDHGLIVRLSRDIEEYKVQLKNS